MKGEAMIEVPQVNEIRAGVFEIFESMFGSALRPTIVKDQSYRFVYLNGPGCRILGRTFNEIVGMTDHDFLARPTADQIRAVDAEVLASGESRSFEEEIRDADGVLRTFVTHKRRVVLPTSFGTKTLLLAIIEDVTDLKETEQVVRASEEHYRSFVELHPQTPWVADASGEVLELGPEWEHASGGAVQEALGRGWASALHPDDAREVERTWGRCVKLGTPFDAVFRIGANPAGYRWFRSRAAPRRDEQGSIIKWYGLLEDIHDRQLALQALRTSERRLRQHSDELEKLVEARTAEVRDKNVELDRLLQQERATNALQRRFVAMISHEFRTPLSVIDAAAQRLARTKAAITPDFLAEKSAQIRGATTRMVDLMESILAAGRLETGTISIDKQLCSLAEIVKGCASRRAEISGSHRIHTDLAALPSIVSADKDALERVFSNLLPNAAKYAPGAPDIYIRGWMEDANAYISVRDCGIGMDRDDLPKLFQPYFRARSATGIAGTGIGLNIVKEILEMHGAGIRVDSVLGQGTTFTVLFPLDDATQQQVA